MELFRNAVGLTPKVYCRIMRFQSVIERLACDVEWSGRVSRWTADIAISRT